MNKKTVLICFSYLVLLSVLYWVIEPVGIDLEFNVMRISELARELSKPGHPFPVYIYTDLYNHYGYPIPLFYGSVSLLPFVLLVRLGLSAFTAYKIMTVTILWMTFASAYLCLKQMPVNAGARFTSAFLYSVQPFLMTELFVRAGIGAALVFVFIPVVMLGYIKITGRDTEPVKGILLLAAGMSGVITSHVTSTLIIVVLLLIVYLVQLRALPDKLPKTCEIALSAVICFMLSAWYLLPVLEQFTSQSFIGSSTRKLMIPYENPIALFIPIHLTEALEVIFHTDLEKSMIGGVILSMILLLVYLWVRRIRLNTWEKKLAAAYFLIIAILLIHWTFIERYISFIQFAWRIFLIAAVAETAFNISLLDRTEDPGFFRFRIWLGILVSAYVLIFFFGYFALRNLFPARASGLLGSEAKAYEYVETGETSDELYLPVSIDKEDIYDGPRTVIPEDDSCSYVIDEDGGRVIIDMANGKTRQDMTLTCPFIMYKGYTAVNEDTGVEYEVRSGATGLTEVFIPEGTGGRIVLSYTGTFLQRLSYVISLITLAACVVLWFIWYNRIYGKK